MDLKKATISGMGWSFVESIFKQGTNVIIAIILARILSPVEFGLVGILMIFITISQTIVDSGFSSALIRQSICTDEDYSTVLLTNLSISIGLYALMYVVAPFIAAFFNEDALNQLLKVIGIVLIINAFGIIQRVQLVRELNFKKQAWISFIASFISGIIGISAAIYGMGVWSLLIKIILEQLVEVLILWGTNKWKPIIIFSITSFKSLFGFGSKLMISGIIDSIFRRVFYFVIGKYFNVATLGYYTQADQLGNLPVQNLTRTIQRVSYSSLSKVKDDMKNLKNHFRTITNLVMLISCPLMLGIAAMADTIVIVLLGERWAPAIPFLRLMAITGMLYPLHSLNLNIIQIKGRSDIFLKLEIIKKILIIPIILIGIKWGIMSMLYGMLILSFFVFFINSYPSGKMLQYPGHEQIRDILPSFFVGCFIFILILMMNNIFDKGTMVLFISQILIGIISYFIILELFQFTEYIKLRLYIISFYNKSIND